jgi:soluble lytic murein transglycosylase-like protein
MRNTVLLGACVTALAAALLVAPAPSPRGAGLGSLLGGAAAAEPAAGAQAPPPVRAAYARWRRRLDRHDLFVGRNLLPEVRAADGTSRPPTSHELRRSIWRMQRRWSRWLRTSARGRAVRFKLIVRARVPGWGRAHLRAIARCESRNDPRAVGGGGAYRGLYQFSFSTWRVVGGTGDPAAAPRWEQTWRAWLLLSRHGSGHWPVCG